MFSRFTFYILFTFVTINCYGQGITVQYEYNKHVFKDSSDIVTQYTYLKIGKESSLFFSEAAFKSDSIMTQNDKNGEKINFKNLPKDMLGIFIKKNIKSESLFCYSFEFIGNQFKYKEIPNFKWVITNKSKNILGKYVILAKTS